MFQPVSKKKIQVRMNSRFALHVSLPVESSCLIKRCEFSVVSLSTSHHHCIDTAVIKIWWGSNTARFLTPADILENEKSFRVNSVQMDCEMFMRGKMSPQQRQRERESVWVHPGGKGGRDSLRDGQRKVRTVYKDDPWLCIKMISDGEHLHKSVKLWSSVDTICNHSNRTLNKDGWHEFKQ